jgi:hypothetical protein
VGTARPADEPLRSIPARADVRRRWTERAIEVARAVNAADDRVERDRLDAERLSADAAQRLHDLVVGQHHVHVVGLAPEERDQARELAAPARAQEVIASVGLG